MCDMRLAVKLLRARIGKRLWSPRIDSAKSIAPGWESITGLPKRFTNTGSEYSRGDLSHIGGIDLHQIIDAGCWGVL
jgi:hypothetical protein